MRRSLLALACIAGLTACGDSTQSLRELRTVTPSTDAYQAAVASGYRQLAEEKLAAYNWSESERFADKGLAAAYGRDIEPESPAEWQIDEEDQNQFAQARTQLLEAITATKTTQPAQAANALVQYDRWLSLASGGWDDENIHAAHAAFASNLGNLQQAQAPEPGISVPTSEPMPLPEPQAVTAPEPIKPPEKPKLDITVLYFPFDADTLGASAKQAIAGLVEKIHAASAEARITINGHTDRAGTETYNINLSERRAHYVQRALVSSGIPEKRTQAFGFGESDPAVPTADEVREPKNRRVEIVVE